MSMTLSLPPCLRTRALQLATKPQTRSLIEVRRVSPRPFVNPPLKAPLPKFPFERLHYRWNTVTPTAQQLEHATEFFSKKPPTFLWSAEKFKTMDYSVSPEVCFLGRSNVGKSSLLNALLGRKIAHTSAKTGRTRLMNAFAVNRGEGNYDTSLVVIDMPGYGHSAREEWGKEIIKYLSQRKALKMVFLLIDAMHGIKRNDVQLLTLLKENAVPYQIVLSKADRIIFPVKTKKESTYFKEERFADLDKTLEKARLAVEEYSGDEEPAVGEILSCSAEKSIDGKKMGIDAVRFAMLRAAELEYKPKAGHAKPIAMYSHEEMEEMMKSA